MYCYMFLAAMVFVSRLALAYMLKGNEVESIVPGLNIGLGSYLNHGLGKLVKNTMYANVILNTIVTFVSCILIKKIVLNIISNDVLATLTSVTYIFIPKAMMYVGEYVRYSYNVLLVLIGI